MNIAATNGPNFYLFYHKFTCSFTCIISHTVLLIFSFQNVAHDQQQQHLLEASRNPESQVLPQTTELNLAF